MSLPAASRRILLGSPADQFLLDVPPDVQPPGRVVAHTVTALIDWRRAAAVFIEGAEFLLDAPIIGFGVEKRQGVRQFPCADDDFDVILPGTQRPDTQ